MRAVRLGDNLNDLVIAIGSKGFKAGAGQFGCAHKSHADAHELGNGFNACRGILELIHYSQNILEDFCGGLHGVDTMHKISAIEVEQWLGVLFIDIQALQDDLVIGIVEPVFF